MKNLFAIIFSMVLMSCQKKDSINNPGLYQCSVGFADSSGTNPNKNNYQQVINQMVNKGVAGAMMAVYKPASGMWLGAAGKSDLKNNVPMQACNISRMGSTIKLFTAVVTMMLYDEHKINLDEKISAYLHGDYIGKLTNCGRATIRQLLQHSSGIYNYIQNPAFQTASLNDLTKIWQPEELLSYAYNKNAYFQVGADVRYSNTNYILLGFLIEQIEGKPLHQVFEQRIFQPLGMNKSLFAAKDPVPQNIVRGYIDLYSNGQLTESTQFSGWDYHTADGGLISNPYDMAVFFQKLIKGEIISPSLLNEMLTWKIPLEQDDDFFPVEYGLGIFKMKTPAGDVYYHSGDAIGYYANMMYIPATETVVVYSVNSNYGKMDEWVSSKSAIQNVLNAIW